MIVSFALSCSTNRFLLSLTLLSLRQNRAFAKDLRKTGNIAGVLEPKNVMKPSSNEQMKKLFDSGELDGQRAKIQHNYRGQPSFTSALFRQRRTRELTPANVKDSGFAKNPWRS